MESAPEGLDIDSLVRQMQRVEGVEDVHHLHVWQLDEHENALEAHVVIEDAREMERIKGAVKKLLKDDFDVTHPTLELELTPTAERSSHDTSVIPEH